MGGSTTGTAVGCTTSFVIFSSALGAGVGRQAGKAMPDTAASVSDDHCCSLCIHRAIAQTFLRTNASCGLRGRSQSDDRRGMVTSQVITLLVLAAVVAALIWDKMRADVVALSGAAFLLMTGVVRPVEVQAAFASPAIVALASLFVIAYAMELSGLLDAGIRLVVRMCKRIGTVGLWILIGLAGSA